MSDCAEVDGKVVRPKKVFGANLVRPYFTAFLFLSDLKYHVKTKTVLLKTDNALKEDVSGGEDSLVLPASRKLIL